jgi:hypothetical protein
VYHDLRACPVGEALARFDRIAGTRGLPRCETCTGLRSAAVHAPSTASSDSTSNRHQLPKRARAFG